MSNLFNLPEIQFVGTDPEEIRNQIITVYEAVSGRRLFPGDPVRLFLMAMANVIIQQRVLINDSAKQNLLRYARGPMLDHLGALVETERLPEGAARTTMQFDLSAPLLQTAIIPQGTRTSPGGELYFATMEPVEIPPGILSIQVTSICLEAGEIGNGYVPGQINILVDPLPYVASVANVTESAGGTDVEADDPYRERIYTSPERFSVAGPRGAYEYWARTASTGIADVLVYSPAPVEVEIRVLMSGGELPTPDILSAVDEVVNDQRIRPLTDKVTVLAPDEITYEINLTYWIAEGNATSSVAIQAAVNQAITDYVLWQKSRIGRDINPSELSRRVMNAGALRVEIASPVFTAVDETDVAIAGGITVTYGGLQDD
ncbi:baseplate assembly protein [Paenibacillus daejeonensis]|uniref:baseplate assembly protein n=1 Tax=Paenibacillus daejeonensis TaxID=135193 RepID=UPI000366D09B|nr:baseplate J/gp47 family protein [Paenibacillus daejeonensis]